LTSEPTSLLCFRNGSIGNTLAAVPALRSLKAAYPSAKLSVVVDPIGYQLLEHCPWINELIVYDKHGRDKGAWRYLRLLSKLRRTHPSHAVLFKRFFRNGLLAFLAGAPVRAGFATGGRAPFLNVTVPYEEGVSVVDLNLQLAEALGAASTGRELELFLSQQDYQQAASIYRVYVQPGESYVVAHYGGSTTAPDFVPIARFEEILHAVAGDGETVFLMGQGESETKDADAIARYYRNARVVCGLPIRTAAALIARSRLFVGFNSGPAHIAASVRTPELIFFRPDRNVANEIRKWCPPFDNALPLVPPPPKDEESWTEFLQEIHSLATRYSAE
jgi:ADP-heptose:LPS heptosyltransferase